MKRRALLALVRREWRDAWTDRGAYALRALYAGALLGGSVLAWILLPFIQPMRLEELPKLAREIFGLFCRTQFLLATLLAAAAYARAVARERERGTMDLLLLSSLSPFEILLAKVAGEFLGLVALLAAGLPVIFFLLPLGGLSATEMLTLHAILLGWLLALGGLCAALAAWFSRAVTVMIGCWTAIGLWIAAPWLGRAASMKHAKLWNAIERASPLAPLERELGSPYPEPALAFAVMGVGLAAAVVLCGLGGAVLKKRHQAGPRGEGFWRRLFGRFRRWGTSRRTRLLFRPFFRYSHPLTRRECGLERDAGFRIGWIFSIAAYVTAIFFVMAESWRDGENHVILGMWGLALSVLLATVLGSFSVGADRRRGYFENLIAMGVPPEDIVRSRLAGLCLRAAYLAAVPVIHLAVMFAILWDGSWYEIAWHIALGMVGIAAAVIAVMGVTLWMAILFRRSEIAVMATVIVGMPVALPVAVMVGASLATLALGVPLAAAVLMTGYAWMVRNFRGRVLR